MVQPRLGDTLPWKTPTQKDNPSLDGAPRVHALPEALPLHPHTRFLLEKGEQPFPPVKCSLRSHSDEADHRPNEGDQRRRGMSSEIIRTCHGPPTSPITWIWAPHSLPRGHHAQSATAFCSGNGTQRGHRTVRGQPGRARRSKWTLEPHINRPETRTLYKTETGQQFLATDFHLQSNSKFLDTGHLRR